MTYSCPSFINKFLFPRPSGKSNIYPGDTLWKKGKFRQTWITLIDLQGNLSELSLEDLERLLVMYAYISSKMNSQSINSVFYTNWNFLNKEVVREIAKRTRKY